MAGNRIVHVLKTHGMRVTSNGTASEAQFSTIARGAFLTFGQDPNDLTNAEGRLPNDRPHILRATGVWQLPWQRVLVAANVQSCVSTFVTSISHA